MRYILARERQEYKSIKLFTSAAPTSKPTGWKKVSSLGKPLFPPPPPPRIFKEFRPRLESLEIVSTQHQQARLAIL